MINSNKLRHLERVYPTTCSYCMLSRFPPSLIGSSLCMVVPFDSIRSGCLFLGEIRDFVNENDDCRVDHLMSDGLSIILSRATEK